MNFPLLISIHPEFVEKIISGQKVFEFRKTLPSQLPTHLVIYATSPVQRVVAVAEINEALTGSPSGIWERSKKGAGITRAYFRQYFSGRKSASAFKIGKVAALRRPLSLQEINPILVAPQSYRKLDIADFALIQSQLTKLHSIPAGRPSM